TVTVIFVSVAETTVACVSPKRTTLAPDSVAKCVPFRVTAWPTSPAAGSTPVTCGEAVNSHVASHHRPATTAIAPTPTAMSFGSTAGPRRRGGGIGRPRTGTRATGTRPLGEGAGAGAGAERAAPPLKRASRFWKNPCAFPAIELAACTARSWREAAKGFAVARALSPGGGGAAVMITDPAGTWARTFGQS